ncbi:hypothetical protein C8A05DRAFT_38596 [Staphylotrichum tortipilum]|uniref:Uncharacterized protein n=1 Tax=Staphylotrichum tortipilum TaxID=2831512 RepID=A0AAN6RPX4_9PEZI|nr:hypothetical protein C8A05DRAFT_38596 [Staphylotrichum longicolle]
MDTPQATATKPQPMAQSSTALTLDTLRAFVHASPQLHSVYAQDRLRILRAFVEQNLDGILSDAHAVYLSGTGEFQQTRDEPML